MQKDTARSLLQTITDITSLTHDAQHKLMALEKVLQEYEPEMFDSYQRELEAITRRPPFSVNVAGVANLQQKLVEDR